MHFGPEDDAGVSSLYPAPSAAPGVAVEITDAQADEIANACYSELLVTTTYSGGMGGLTWDRALVRATIFAMRGQTPTGREYPVVKIEDCELIEFDSDQPDGEFALVPLADLSQPSNPIGYPECTGDPNSCPENEGRGCCTLRTALLAGAAGGGRGPAAIVTGEGDTLNLARRLPRGTRLYAHPPVPVRAPQGVLPANMGYEPDGPVGMALSWLKSAIACESFVWDGDQREYATQSLHDAEKWLADLLAATLPSAAPAELINITGVGMRDGVYIDSTPLLSVGGSAFEDWFQGQAFATQPGIKQISRDSYAAGMGDPLVTYAAPPPGEVQVDAAWQSINSMNLTDDLVWLRKGDAIEGPRIAETDDYDRYAFWASCEPPGSRQDPARLERRLEICYHERMRAEFRADLHFKTLMGIFNLLNPEATALGDGRIMKFANPYANETLDKLSARIRSIKSDVESAAIASTTPPVNSGGA